MKDLNFKPLFTKENSSFWLRTDMKFARTKTSEVFDRAAKNANTRFLKKILKVLPSNCFIAGGAAKDVYTNNTENINDIDIYSPSQEDAIKVMEALKSIKGEAIKQTNMAIAVRVKEDLPIASIIKICYFDNMEHCLDSFDFTICQFALGVEESICNPMGLIDHLNKKLNIHVLQPQTDCLYRLVKYVKKGYTPTNDALDKMHDFLSGNRTPVRAERPPTYGAEAIDNAINAIRPAIAGVVPPPVYATPAPRMNIRNPRNTVVVDSFGSSLDHDPSYVMSVDNGREDGYSMGSRTLTQNDIVDAEFRQDPEPARIASQWTTPISNETLIEVISSLDRELEDTRSDVATLRQNIVAGPPPGDAAYEAAQRLANTVEFSPGLVPGDSTIVFSDTTGDAINRLRNALESGAYNEPPAALGGPTRAPRPRRGRNGLIRGSSGGTQQ